MNGTQDHTAGLATEASGPTLDQQNEGNYSNAFDAAMQRAGIGGEQVVEKADEAEVTPETKTETPTVQKSAEPEPEFPAELLTGEKPAEKTAEPEKDDLDDILPSPKLGEQQRSNFAKLKDLTRAARKEAAEFRAQLEEARKTPKTTADQIAEREQMTKYQSRIAELEETIERAHFQSSPRFKRLSEGAAQAITDAKSYLEGTEVDGAIVDAASRATGAKRIRILEDAGLSPAVIAAVAPHLAEADRLNREQSVALENSKGLREQWEREEAARQQHAEASIRAEEDRIFNETGEKISKVFEPFQKIPGNDKWNAAVDALEARAKEFYNGKMSYEDIAEIARYGVGARTLHRMYHVLREENKTLKERLGKMSVAQPNGGGANGGSGNGATNNQPMTEDQLFQARQEAFERSMAAHGGI